MGEFRIGRKYAQHSYPDRPRGPGTSTPFARNFASGPAAETDITVDGVQLPWAAIDVGSPGPDVPITPLTTGIIRISGGVTVKNHSGSSRVVVLVQVEVNGTPLSVPLGLELSLPINSIGVIPILIDTSALALNTEANIQILVSSEDADGNEISISLESSTLDLQEVAAATG